MTAKFSVILPVCHGRSFLEKALRSLGHVIRPEGVFDVLMMVPVLLLPLHPARIFGYVFPARLGSEAHP